MNVIVQGAIVFFSGAAIWIVARREPWAKWGWVLGLAGQPLWLWSTWHTQQWGMFLLSVFYTWAWISGIRANFGGGRDERKTAR